MPSLEGSLLLVAQPCGQLFASPAESAVGHVAENAGFGQTGGKGAHGAGRFGGRSEVGIAEAEVAHGVVAVFLAQLDAGFKHPPDHGSLRKILLHGGAENGSGHGSLLE